MKICLRTVLSALCACFFSSLCWADGYSATQNLFTNLVRSRVDVNSLLKNYETNLEVITVMPTLVRGLYFVQQRNNGKPIIFTNEQGTVMGVGDITYVVPTDGSKVRPMTDEEKTAFRGEIMANIEYEKLIKVTYGNGGGRRILLRSAIDCPACKDFEDIPKKLLKHDPKLSTALNTTFYIIPSSLQELEPNGWNAWKDVSNLWCSNNKEDAWKTYWSKRTIPAGDISKCAFRPLQAARLNASLSLILLGVGVIKTSYVPMLVKEDGTILDEKDIKEYYGSRSRPSLMPVQPNWLQGGVEATDFVSRPSGKPSKSANKQVINLGEAIRGIFK